MQTSREWIKDSYGTYIYWQSNKQVLGTIKMSQNGTYEWEARIQDFFRKDGKSDTGIAATLKGAMNIVETILIGTDTVRIDPWAEKSRKTWDDIFSDSKETF